ncbi:bactofilin family protein [Myroides guanonis]|uniref:Protein CcmA, bactofilin family n=1 Tax=Myroides guanonis TaxID=1150112 RepID=A0A1I3RJ16_9FLAO|nr:polymer-forming cytoskeletal protein [Myroides guanonis]SFJ45156.1 protein CcmA, bactofilin family [Myroides guanonis]
MFKKNEKIYTDLLGRTNRIVEGTKITGTIETQADIRLDGFLKGDLNVVGRLVIGPKGVVEGDVSCVNADVEGTIKGNVVVQEVLVVKATAIIEGEVTVGKLSVEPGAVFKAVCSMTGLPGSVE